MVAVRSIRERILKDELRASARQIREGCSEVDPGEDTESPERQKRYASHACVAVRSIRERILKVQINALQVGKSQVAVRSIRERILKDDFSERPGAYRVRCSEVDPGEDTERPHGVIRVVLNGQSCSEVDPGEDTERTASSF